MTRPAIRGTQLLAAFLLVALPGCDQSTAPAGTPAEVTVRAYVDVDGTGSFSAGDQAIEGATVQLEARDGGAGHTTSTDGEGIARFVGVDPGSYTAHFDGSIPDGAVLSSSPRPTVVVPFQGGNIDAEFRFAFRPGDLSGVVYRDDDESGDFTEGVDAGAPGVTVRVYSGTDTSGEPRATTVTDGEGRFGFDGLRAGPNTLVFDHPETIEIVGGATQQVEVQPVGITELEVRFEGTLLVSIADAREAPDGGAVEVEGVVLADQGTYDFQGRDTYIQDGTGGVRLWALDGDLGLEVGDSVRVSGAMGTFREERQLNVTTLTVLGTGTVPAPRPVTGAEINSFEFDGQLAVTGAVVVVEVQVGAGGFGDHNVTVEDEAGDTFVVRMESPNEIPPEFWEEGDVHVVTGVLGRFFDDGQIKPRGFSDVVQPVDIAEARAAPDGESVLVEGVVLADQGTYDFRDRDTYIQDGTAGVRLWGLDGDLGLEAGDSVRVSGSMGTFREERQLEVASVTVLGTGTMPVPREVTGAEINGLEYDGQLAVTGVITVVEVQVGAGGFGDHNVTVEDEAGDTFVVRVESPNEIPSDYWEEGASYVVTGVLGRFFDDGQIKPRGFDDVEEY